MKRWFVLVILLAVLCGVWAQADGATKYFSSTGSGSTCSSGSPCSIDDMCTLHSGGDELVIKDGLHSRTTPFPMGDNNGTCLKSGATASQPTILRAETPLGSTLRWTGTGTSTSRIIVIGIGGAPRANITVKDLILEKEYVSGLGAVTIRGSSTNRTKNIIIQNNNISATGGRDTASCLSASEVENTTIRGNDIHNCGPPEQISGPGVHGMYLQRGDTWFIEDNRIYDNNGIGFQFFTGGADAEGKINDATIRHNIVYGNGQTGIYVSRGNNHRVHHNVVYNNRGTGINISASITRGVVYNNSTYNNNLGNFPDNWELRMGGSGVAVNNILRNPAGNHMNSPSGWRIGTNTTSGTVTDLWVDPTNATLALRDFTLKIGSAGIDSGDSEICTSSDVGAGKCKEAISTPNCVGACDQGAFEFALPPPPPPLGFVGNYGLNGASTDASDFNNHGADTGIIYVTTAPTPIENTHSAQFDATGDRIIVPTNGWSADGMRFAWSAYIPDTTIGRNQFLIGHSSSASSYINRIQSKILSGGSLALGLGDNVLVAQNIFTPTEGAWHRYVLQFAKGAQAGSGTWTIWVDGLVKATGTYSGLSQLGANASFGNNGVGQSEGLVGNLDKMLIGTDAWTQADVDADCALYCVAPPPPPPPPTFVACVLSPTGWTTDDTGRTWTGQCQSAPVDPALVCEMSDGQAVRLTGAYNSGTQPTVTSCARAGDGQTLTLGVDVPPPNNLATITLQYASDTPVAVTNAFAPPNIDGIGLTQTHVQCRRDGADDFSPLMGAPNTPCKDVAASSPGQVNVIMGFTNTKGVALAAVRTSIECKLNAGPYVRVGSDYSTIPVRFYRPPTGRGLPDNTTFSTGLLPTPGGTTLVRRTLRRSDGTGNPPDIPNNGYVVDEWALEIQTGLVPGTDTITCWTVLQDGEQFETYDAVAVIPIRAPRLVVRK